MKISEQINIPKQVFGIIPFPNTCFCQLITAYNTYFKEKNIAPCLGNPNMRCLIYSIEGEGLIISKRQVKTKLPKHTIFFGEMKSLQYIKANSNEWHFICYWYLLENSDLDLKGLHKFNEINFEKEVVDVNKIIQLIQTRSFLKASQASAIFTQKILNLAELLQITTTKSNTLKDKIILFVNSHIKEKLTTKNIAQEFGYCEKHIRYIFNKNFNMSPCQFIDSLKLEQILAMLQTSSNSLEQLAELFNYSSASHLISKFKKKYGDAPKKYLNKLKIRQEYAKI